MCGFANEISQLIMPNNYECVYKEMLLLIHSDILLTDDIDRVAGLPPDGERGHDSRGVKPNLKKK